MGRPIECVTLPVHRFNELPEDVARLVRQHFSPDSRGNIGVPKNGLDEMNLSFYVNVARRDGEVANAVEEDGEDLSTFQPMVTTRIIQAGEELLLSSMVEPISVEPFAPSSDDQVDYVMERLMGCNTILKPSTIRNAGLGVFALQDLLKGERPFPVLHEGDTVDISTTLADSLLSNDDDLPILQMLNDYFVEHEGSYPVLPSGLNDIDASFYINSAPRAGRTNLKLMDDPNLHSAFKEWVTTRIIYKGEELFESYGDQDLELVAKSSIRQGFASVYGDERTPYDSSASPYQYDGGSSSHERGSSSHERGGSSHERGGSSHERGSSSHDRGMEEEANEDEEIEPEEYGPPMGPNGLGKRKAA